MAAGAAFAAQAADVRPRRARRFVGLGTVPRLLRGRGWEGHAINLRNHYWSQTADPATLSFDTYVEDVVATLDRLGPTTVAVGHGMGALLALKAAERVAISGLVLIGPQMPRDLAAGSALRAARGARGLWPQPDRLGDAARAAAARRPRPDLSDVLRIQHLLGQKPHEAGAARRQVIAGIPVDRRVVSEVPRLVIAGGLDRYTSLDDAERLAEWLDAGFEPFGAHSHYGLIHGEASYQQVAEAVRTFLETYRL